MKDGRNEAHSLVTATVPDSSDDPVSSQVSELKHDIHCIEERGLDIVSPSNSEEVRESASHALCESTEARDEVAEFHEDLLVKLRRKRKVLLNGLNRFSGELISLGDFGESVSGLKKDTE
jgi:hypothetical protein